jgi:hypothetical protein
LFLISLSLEKGEAIYMNGRGYSRSAAIRGVTVDYRHWQLLDLW